MEENEILKKSTGVQGQGSKKYWATLSPMGGLCMEGGFKSWSEKLVEVARDRDKGKSS